MQMSLLFEEEKGINSGSRLECLGSICNDREVLGSTMHEFINTEWAAEQLTNAHVLRQEVNKTMRKLMQDYDLLLTPMLAFPPFEVGINGPIMIDGRKIHTGYRLFSRLI